jgi:hypothetical protein
MKIESLPFEMFMVIHSFLSVRPLSPHHAELTEYHVDYNEEYLFDLTGDKNWNSFLNTSKLFCDAKFRTGYYLLSESWSKKFVGNSHFRSLVRDHVCSSGGQLALHLSTPISSYVSLSNLHLLWLFCISHVPIHLIQNVKYLLFNRCTFAEVPGKQIIHSEVVSFENMFVSLEKTSFTNLRKIYFCWSRVRRLSRLNDHAQLRLLYIVNCTNPDSELHEQFDCHQLESIFITNSLLKWMTNYYHVKDVRRFTVSSSLQIASEFGNS